MVAARGDGDQSTLRTAAIALIGTGLVLATLLAFYAVGLSEDREREQEAERRRDVPPRPPARPGRRPPRPPRRRDHD